MSESTERSRWRAGWAWAVIFLVTLAAYWPAINGGFIWDDNSHVTRPALQSVHGLWRIWFELNATQQYYPVLHSAFWVEHRLWGDAAAGYHVVNILLHATAAWLFMLILRRLRIPGSLLAALIFALHPVCVESVAWISEQKNTLSTVFYLLAAIAYLRWRDEVGGGRPEDLNLQPPASNLRPRALRWYFLATLLFVAALLSKSVTATLPAALLVVLWWQHGRLSWKRDVVPLLSWFAIGAAGGLLTAWVERRYIGAEGAAYALGFLQRILLAGRVICFYLGKLFWPGDLIFIYPHWRIDSGDARAYLFLLGVAVLALVLWLIRKRTRGPLAALLFFTGSLFPALGFFNIFPFVYSYVADHFQYLASLGIIALVAAGWRKAKKRKSEKAKNRLAVSRFPDFPISRFSQVALLAVLATLTWRQCRMYSDVETLYRTTIDRNPACWMAHYNLGVLFTGGSRVSEGISHFERAIEIKPDLAVLRSDFGTVLVRAGRLPEAIAQYEEAVRLNPAFAAGHLNLGAALNQAGRTSAAIAECEEALRLQPIYPEANFNLALAFQSAGRAPEAIVQFQNGLRISPSDAMARNYLGILLARTGRLPEAAGQFEEELRMDPGNAGAHYDLGLVLMQQDRLQEAKAQFEQALRIKPGYREAIDGLAELQGLMPKK